MISAIRQLWLVVLCIVTLMYRLAMTLVTTKRCALRPCSMQLTPAEPNIFEEAPGRMTLPLCGASRLTIRVRGSFPGKRTLESPRLSEWLWLLVARSLTKARRMPRCVL